LIDICAALGGEALERPLEAAFWEGGEVVFEGRIPLSQLLQSIVPGHLAGHAQQLAGAPN
jgi:hypothetical protein